MIEVAASLAEQIAQRAERLPSLQSPDFGRLAHRFADKRIVIAAAERH
jgi:hypothetical protein